MTKQTPSQQAGILVLGKSFATMAEAIAPLVLVRLLGKADFGVLATLLLVYNTLALVMSAGFPGSVIYFLASRSIAQRRYLAFKICGTMVGLGAILGGILLLLAAIIYGNVLYASKAR